MADIRGKKTQTLFGEVEVIDEQDGRGRNAELLARRNRHLLCRYAWYCGDRRNDYRWIVEQLCNEFYLTASTVGQLIEGSLYQLQGIRNEKLTDGQLAVMYPFFRWRR